MTTTQDTIPRRGRRSHLWSGGVRAAARVVAHTTTTVVAAALGVAAVAGWSTPVALAGWTTAAAAGAAGVLAGTLRVVLGTDVPADRERGRLLLILLTSVFTWAFMATSAICLSWFCHAHALDRHATLKVPATVSDCENRGDSNECTYHWLAGDRAYRSRDTADRAWPDGHRVTVPIDPAHPGRQAVVTRGYWAAWIGVAVGALGTPFGAVTVWVLESDLGGM
ncbi:DUF3592 domain-containing protein [Streptomyces sp. HPF1205]|uniref:DUF3592 domain-containing protein n=1 Tax=Streptomyces sp. HPF1205 TaxID=2873262 RepID=UPI001CEC5AF3|nr:DUF3592 domain-containing protein [Streptomyces sp. HPF1205]